MYSTQSPVINKRRKTISFCISNSCARHISLAGSFNHWVKDQYPLTPDKFGNWKIEIPMLPQGTYYYKFFIDEHMAMEDIENPLREPDGIVGWNSVLTV